MPKPKINLKDPTPVYVEWVDAAQATNGWKDESDISKEANDNFGLIQTLGWLIADTPQYILLVSDLCKDMENCYGLSKIPKGCIKRIIKLNKKTRKKCK